MCVCVCVCVCVYVCVCVFITNLNHLTPFHNKPTHNPNSKFEEHVENVFLLKIYVDMVIVVVLVVVGVVVVVVVVVVLVVS